MNGELTKLVRYRKGLVTIVISVSFGNIEQRYKERWENCWIDD